MDIESYINLKPFSLDKIKKRKFFEKTMNSLNLFHYKNSKEYKKLLDSFGYSFKKKKLNEIPFLPAKLFKYFELRSVSKGKVFKTLSSSGTSSEIPSKIYLDKKNAHNQMKVLNKIITTVLGKERLPMLIIDQNPTKLNRSTFNARGAAIYGFSIFGKNHTYLLNDQGKIDYNLLNIFLNKYGKGKFFIFGFTSLVFENLVKKISTKLIKFDFRNGILLHGGGWKKMQKIKINNKTFKQKLFSKIKLKNIYNYYGLVEQTGSIFIECKKCKCFVTSVFSDILIRDKYFNVVKNGKKGLIQLFSLLPTSYPGHNILTEDIGEIVGDNGCQCGLLGKQFLVHGRAEQSEIRGCSDT
tara:strand:- start:833 stop:1894 length:1062 start_codon:yes stop_codon:yes gene_type:complete